MIETLAKMKHHIWMAYFKPKTGSGHNDWGELIAGIGQGNRAGPAIWAAVSTPLFQILVEEGFLATIICAISIHKCSIVGFSFVNDTDLCITVADNKLPSVLHRMQQSFQMWANLL